MFLKKLESESASKKILIAATLRKCYQTIEEEAEAYLSGHQAEGRKQSVAGLVEHKSMEITSKNQNTNSYEVQPYLNMCVF